MKCVRVEIIFIRLKNRLQLKFHDRNCWKNLVNLCGSATCYHTASYRILSIWSNRSWDNSIFFEKFTDDEKVLDEQIRFDITTYLIPNNNALSHSTCNVKHPLDKLKPALSGLPTFQSTAAARASNYRKSLVLIRC